MAERGDRPRQNLTVELPAGGHLTLANADEVTFWNENAERFMDDYGITKQNDKVQVMSLLTQSLEMFRATQLLSDPETATEGSRRIAKASEEMRNLEKALGVDKRSREAGGQHTVDSYLTTLKRTAHAKGIRISERVKEYERVMMEARWKIRLLRNGDAEDRGYHGLTESKIITWLEGELAAIEEKDKEWAKENGKIFVGKL